MAASGRKWPQVAASGLGGLLEQMAASGRKWPQGAVGASGRKWPQVAAGRKGSLEQVHGSHLQPLAATRVAAHGASGRRRLLEQVFASGASGREWQQVMASGRK